MSMPPPENQAPPPDAASALARQVGKRAENLFRTRQVWCGGAVLLALNEAFEGGLTEQQAVRAASGLGHGMGGSGCACGALTGAVVGLGCVLGHGRLAPRGDATVLQASRELHERFAGEFGAACCRVLTRGLRQGSASQFDACAKRTGRTAELAARIAIEHRPELATGGGGTDVLRRDSKLRAWLKIAASRLGLARLWGGRNAGRGGHSP